MCIVCAAFLTDRDTAKAAPKELEILPTDVTTASDGCILVGIEGEYAAQVKDALDRVNEIRKEACQEGVPDPSSPNRKLKPADYVPIQWSSSLEYIARIRAAEAAQFVFLWKRLTALPAMGKCWHGIQVRMEAWLEGSTSGIAKKKTG